MPPVSKFRAIMGWVREFLWFLSIFFYLIVYLFWRPRPSVQGQRRAIILVPDFFCPPTYYLSLRRALVQAGFPVFIARTGSVFRPLREHGRRLSLLLNEWGIEDGILLAHGAGGLATLSLQDASRQRIEHLIALGTPFHGSRLFLWTPYISAMRDTAVGSDYLLIHRMNALLFTSFTPFIAWQDEWIVPFTLARFGQGRDLVFDTVGRYNLVRSRENIDTLVDFLNDFYPDRLVPPAAVTPLPAPSRGKGKAAARKAPAGKSKPKARSGRK